MSGRVVVITGAGGHLGSELARRFGAAGDQVVLVGRTSATLDAVVREIVDAGGEAWTLRADVGAVEEVKQHVNRILERERRIDVLVNNAGVSIRRSARDITLDDWQSIVAVNLTAVLFWSQAIGAHMCARGSGAIVNVTSTMGFRPWKLRLLNAVTRAGADQLTRALAVEWAPQGVRVNAVAPTFIESPAMEKVLDDSDLRSEVLARIPLGRTVTRDEVASAICYLASGEASGITGHVLPVDGGWTAW